MSFSDTQANCVVLAFDGEAVVTLAGTVVKGDLVGYSSGWKRTLATAGGVVHARCIAIEDGVATERIPVAFDFALLEGTRFTGGTAGADLYAAEGTDSGKYTETAPSTSDDAYTKIGVVVTPIRIIVTPNANTEAVKA